MIVRGGNKDLRDTLVCLADFLAESNFESFEGFFSLCVFAMKGGDSMIVVNQL